MRFWFFLWSILNKEKNWQISQHDLYAGFYYYPDTLPLCETDYDEFIYYDHQYNQPGSDMEAKHGLEAVDRGYEEHKPLPKSIYFLPHWYETGSKVIEHVSKNWGMKFIAQVKDADMPWNDSVPWVRQGPFRLYEKPGPRTAKPSPEFRGTNPLYYADFTRIVGSDFFNCFAEIRLVTEGIKKYNPVFLTTDDALKMVRTMKTSFISGVAYDPDRNHLTVTLKGFSDIASSFWLFTEKNGSIIQKLIMTPSFEGTTEITEQFNRE